MVMREKILVVDDEKEIFENMGSAVLADGGILGGKTGYTKEAGLCLASLASVQGEEYILVTAHANGSHDTAQYHIEDAVSVFNQIRKN